LRALSANAFGPALEASDDLASPIGSGLPFAAGEPATTQADVREQE
jgi:hypothetical protein